MFIDPTGLNYLPISVDEMPDELRENYEKYRTTTQEKVERWISDYHRDYNFVSEKPIHSKGFEEAAYDLITNPLANKKYEKYKPDVFQAIWDRPIERDPYQVGIHSAQQLLLTKVIENFFEMNPDIPTLELNDELFYNLANCMLFGPAGGIPPGRRGQIFKTHGWEQDGYFSYRYAVDTDTLRVTEVHRDGMIIGMNTLGLPLLTPPKSKGPKKLPKFLHKLLSKYKTLPEKLNRGGTSQPYDPVTGRFLPYAAQNYNIQYSGGARFVSGFLQGYAESQGAQGGYGVGKAGNIGYTLGQLIGTILQ